MKKENEGSDCIPKSLLVQKAMDPQTDEPQFIWEWVCSLSSYQFVSKLYLGILCS